MREIRPNVRAGKIRHAGGAVVDDGEPAVRQVEVAQRREAGVGRGEHIDARGTAHVVEPGRVRRIVERVVREAPAGERRGIAVHDADAQIRRPARRDASAARRGARASRVRDRRAARRGSRSSAARCRRRPIPDRRSRSRRRCRRRARSRSRRCRGAPCGDMTRRSISANQAGSASNQWKSPLNTMVTACARACASRSTASSAARLP